MLSSPGRVERSASVRLALKDEEIFFAFSILPFHRVFTFRLFIYLFIYLILFLSFLPFERQKQPYLHRKREGEKIKMHGRFSRRVHCTAKSVVSIIKLSTPLVKNTQNNLSLDTDDVFLCS